MDNFKKIIKAKLAEMAKNDKGIEQNLLKPNKNIDDCCQFIINQVKAMRVSVLSDDEVYGLALHYYDEDNIDIGKPVNVRVVCPLSPDEESELKKLAREKVINEEMERVKAKKVEKDDKHREQGQQLSLF